jgi:hypothetical protein
MIFAAGFISGFAVASLVLWRRRYRWRAQFYNGNMRRRKP